MIEKYINPFTDFGFKKLFGEEVNKDLLIDFLNQLLDKGQITQLTYLKNEHLGGGESDRRAIFDLYCENERGEKFIVELQKARQKFFKDRSIYYATFPIQEQAQAGDWSFELKAVYTIAIMDFTFEETQDQAGNLRHDIQLLDSDTKALFYDKLRFIYLEMPKFNKQEHELTTHYEKWLYLLKNLANLQNRPAALQEKVFQRVFEVAEIARYDRKEQQAYQDSLKYYRDLKNSLDTVFEEAFEEGMQKGLQQGLQQGEKQKALDTARRMKEKGFPAAEIAELTGLSVGDIENL